jgi:fructose-1,6-bisphosphatase/inositol monophosphatase family enzyme
MYEKELKFALSVAKKAGQIMRKYYKGDNGSSYKYDNSIVTLADTDINRYLIERVKKTFPTHAVDGEEEKSGTGASVWVCDPVDGTAMFARHIPVAVFSLALTVKGKSVLGVVYDPFSRKLYTATAGGGAYVNGKRLHVNQYRWEDKECIIGFDMIPQAEWNFYAFLNAHWQKSYYVSMGSCIHSCLCVASGDFTAHLFCGTKGKNCDIAAIKVIVEEAGGVVTDIFGGEQDYDKDIRGALVSNGVVHDALLAELKRLL